MLQLVQMARHVTTWLGWTPGPGKTGGAGCECFPADDESAQESSGLATVLMLYVGMAALFLVVNHCTSHGPDQARAKRELAALERRQAQALALATQHSATMRRTSGSPSRSAPADRRMPHMAPEWLGTLPDLIRQVAAPRRPTTLYRQRLRMRLRQQKEHELELRREQEYLRQELLDEKERHQQQDQLTPDWQDVVDEDPPSSGSPPSPGEVPVGGAPSNQLVSLPQRQTSIYFDLPSETE
ncbi:uncharacterized protein Dana_GF20983 [Drosophila ananassae]|uniref:Uncharacterized protein n=1 Tax=Drosophila ananassae TaxID=7217 RepID=B3MRK1_DROAN|nr:uncharacterized protein LOC6503672 [Drosophila ananassae]EDV34406.1 uncharacterized protein Dana_GF20983 [Drosophila ananassae]